MNDIWIRMKKSKQAYLWMSPAFLIVIFATIFPLFFAFDHSLWKTSMFRKIEFVGLKNYIKLFSDQRFWVNVWNSLFFTAVGILLALLIGFILAIMIRNPSRLNSAYRTIILIPWVTNEVVLALMWTWILNPQTSFLYYWANLLGIALPNFFANGTTALITATVLNAWRSLGFALVMILAALSSIPKEIEEACLVDGANKFQRLTKIILPYIQPVILVIVVILTMSFFNIVSFVLTMTGGGPMYSTELLSIRLYKETFTFFNIEISSALTTVILAVNLVFVFIYKKLISDDTY